MKNVLVGQSGGPTAVINSSLAGVYETAKACGAEHVYGMQYGIAGVLEGKLVDLDAVLSDKMDIELLKRTPSSFLGSCRHKLPQPDVDEAPFVQLFDLFKQYDIGAVFYIGGNDSMDTISKLSAYGKTIGSEIRFIGVPKTIDNDLWGTDMTFGFQSAVDIATNVIDCIHSTASSHGRVFIVEVMGHKVGWLTLYAGISGGSDVILIPEIPYDVDEVCRVLKKRKKEGKPFSILAVAEGAISKEEAALSKKEFKAARATMKEPSVSYRLANEISARTGQEIRVTIPGHFQRGGSPCAYDRMLTTRFGTAAAELIANKKFGCMVALQNNRIVPVPLEEVAGKLKTVSLDCDEIRAARAMGISLGQAE